MQLRQATRTDASSIAAISIEVWLGTYLRRGVSAHFADFALQEFTPARIAALIDDPAQFILVSENEEGIDGFIRLSRASPAPVPGWSDTEIATFYVQPRHHGKGIGTALLNAALAHCRDTAVTSVWLTTNAENAPAIAFYRAQGFAEVGQTHFRIGDGAYLNTVFARRTG
ncbi:GNAT family N-acetyltransferase [Seohaeicola saemankumensis]|nr:GNAT family N-acetyltransferase [Seohaeicola saemankumensis]MCA0871914.1 GNAT family N-acetyltransferase [Seohaeicola saemankumensis]